MPAPSLANATLSISWRTMRPRLSLRALLDCWTHGELGGLATGRPSPVGLNVGEGKPHNAYGGFESSLSPSDRLGHERRLTTCGPLTSYRIKSLVCKAADDYDPSASLA